MAKEIAIQKNGLSTKEDIFALKAELKIDIAETKAEMIRWMFIFWLGSVATISGIMFALFHAYIK